jgi:hypothetical protein
MREEEEIDEDIDEEKEIEKERRRLVDIALRQAVEERKAKKKKEDWIRPNHEERRKR